MHVIDVNSGVRVAQGDVGVGPGDFRAPAPAKSTSAPLPPGDYELQRRALRLANWRAAFSARALETGADGDMHTLHRFRHG